MLGKFSAIVALYLLVESASSVDICTFSSDAGPCKGQKTRYFYNSKTGNCETFVYGGCQGNKNNFESLEDCQSRCRKEVNNLVDICTLPSKTGPCRASKTRYYYNSQTGKCELFIYGGCQGNKNNFESLDDCQAKCRKEKPTAVVDLCTRPSDSGPCKAMKIRYYFNIQTGKCEKFVYGGCQGNANNFESMDDCRTKCKKEQTKDQVDICTLSNDTGPCRAMKTRYYYNPKTGSCETFAYGGCQGNKNNFESLNDCQSKCKKGTQLASMNIEPTVKSTVFSPTNICSLPRKMGPCRARMPRYFFNSSTNMCEQFIYGGCRGNKNNFKTSEECTAKCLPTVTSTSTSTVSSPTNICSLTRETGPCRARMPRYFYNSSTNMCEQFIYGGCRGNQNNFKTSEECATNCQPTEALVKPKTTLKIKTTVSSPTIHAVPNSTNSAVPNSTNSAVPSSTNSAVPNSTNSTVTSSNPTVSDSAPSTDQNPSEAGPTSICSLPHETGPCRASMPRYFYNNTTNTCEQFVYGGCRGNRNNFKTIEECTSTCKQTVTSTSTSTVSSPTNICSLTRETGPCRARMPRYFYNSSTNMCEQFIYGGCRGNQNNFKTFEECAANCQPTEALIKPKTTLKIKTTVSSPTIHAVPNSTNSAVPNSIDSAVPNSTNSAVPNSTNSAVPNSTNSTVTSSNPTVPDSTPSTDQNPSEAGPTSICSLPHETGPCRASMPRYFYNNTTNTCEQFVYGGCRGNRNNFKTIEECTSTCKQTDKPQPSREGISLSSPSTTPKTDSSKLNCPKVNCNTVCIHGYKVDVNDCQTCRCKPTPDAECPRTLIASEDCVELLFPECNLDSDCQPRMICCAHGCTKSCILPKRKPTSNIF